MTDIASFQFTDPLTAFNRGAATGNALQRRSTMMQAGNALATGDDTGAANVLYRSGDLQGGLQFQNIAQAQKTQADAAATKTKEDADEAEATAWSDAATRLSQFHQSASSEPGASPATALQRTLGLYDQMTPKLKDAGVDDEDIAQFRQHLQQDPQATFATVAAGAAKSLGYDIVQTKDGDIVAVNKSNPKDTRLVASVNAGAAPAATAPPVAASATASTGTSRGDRNNNPLNLTSLPNGQTWDGQTGSDGNYATFATPQQGFAAADKNLQAYHDRHGINTLSAVIQRWAPPNDGNDTRAYTETVATALGVDPNAPLDLTDPKIRQGVLQAMASVELGHPYAGTQAQPAAPPDMAAAETAARAAGLAWNPGLMRGATPAALAYQAKVASASSATPNAPTPGTVDANGVLRLSPHQPEWVSDGAGGLKNTKTGATEIDHTFHGADDTVLSPEAVTLMAGKYLNNGSLPPFNGKTGTENKTKILNAATKMAGTLGLSADDLVAGTANVKALGSALTKAQGNWTAMARQEEAAQANANLMLSLAPKGAGQTNIPVVNRWLQAGRKQIAGDPDVTSFDSALGGYAEEFAKVMTGSSGSAAATDSARAAAHDRLSKYATQGQLAAGVATMNQEMANQKNAASHVIVGITNQIHGGGRGGPEAEPAAAPAAAPPAHGQRLTPQQAAALPSGTHFIGQDGVERVRK